MSDSPAAAPQAGEHRFKVTGDAHLLLLTGQDGWILSGRRQNTGFEDGAYHVPAGHLEAGESIVDALIREAREETGVTIAPEHAEFVHVMHNASGGGRVAFFSSVQQWDGTPGNREPGKCSELRWFPRFRAALGTLSATAAPPWLISKRSGFLGIRLVRLSAITLLRRGVAHVIDQALAWFCSTGWPRWLSW
jgi:8-oxo-dGTP diphosphatase